VLAAAPGVVLTRDTEAALLAQYQANGFQPLSNAQILAITGAPPAFPASMPRFSDSNEAPDDWARDTAREKVR
jgi:hypothetical protein